MAASPQTMRKLQHARRLLFWLAQAQHTCPSCGTLLLPNNRDMDVDELTVEHLSQSYDHKAKCETDPNWQVPSASKTILMHKSCHKSATLEAKWRFNRCICCHQLAADGHFRADLLDFLHPGCEKAFEAARLDQK
jgi:hypothetical protein